MAHYQNIYNGGNGAPPVAQVAPRMTDWSGEVTPMPADPPMPEAPGRTANWMGWQIVQAYMKRKPETTFRQLIDLTDAQAPLDQSKYNPVR